VGVIPSANLGLLGDLDGLVVGGDGSPLRTTDRYADLMKLRSGTERSNSVKKEAFALEAARHRRSSFWLIPPPHRPAPARPCLGRRPGRRCAGRPPARRTGVRRRSVTKAARQDSTW
jgi:hypothetical protein